MRDWMSLLKDNWKYMLAALVTPALVLFVRDTVRAKTAADVTPVKPINPINPVNPAYNNLRAFLTMIQYAEGTYGANAYRMLYGGRLFSDYGKHPNTAITKSGITSTAAGAYQILYRTWLTVQPVLGLPDFSPISQDRAAIELVRRRGALEDAMAGRFSTAIYKCRKEWASLPGAGYGQGERSMDELVQVFQNAGGIITA